MALVTAFGGQLLSKVPQVGTLGGVATSRYDISLGASPLSCQNIPEDARAVIALMVCRFTKREILSSGTGLPLDPNPGSSPSFSLCRLLFFWFFSNFHSFNFLKN
jgi:hypothetical protein